MQMTYEQAMRPGALMLFAARGGSGYMMRSEKRDGAYGSPNRRPPRRKRAGFFYILCTLLLSVLLWPIGMVMLWQRKVRMTSGTKLLISLLTLCLSVFLIVFALTVPLDNVEFTAFQDKANDWLDKAAADMAVAGDAAIKKTSETCQQIADFTEASRAYAGAYTANAIDEGVRLAGQTRAAIEGLFQHESAAPGPTEAPTDADKPAITQAPAESDAPEQTEAPAESDAPGNTEVPAVVGTAEGTQAPEDAEATQGAETPAATGAARIPNAADDSKATGKPESADATARTDEAIHILLPNTEPQAEAAQPLGEGTLHANGEFEPGDVETSTNAPVEANTAAPLSEATAIPLKPATPLPTEAPAETAPAGDAPVKEVPAEEAPAEETPVEETPTEEAPVEETPVEETPVEEAPTVEAPVEETPIDETPTEAPAEAAIVTAPPEAPSEEERAFTEEAVRNYEETLSERAMTRRQLRYKGGRYFR